MEYSSYTGHMVQAPLGKGQNTRTARPTTIWLKYFDTKDLVWDIIKLTRSTTSANSLLLYLLPRQSNLESTISGDDGKLRRKNGRNGRTMSCRGDRQNC